MLSFGQILILLLLGFLLFGDTRQIFNRLILFFVNCKTLIKKLLVQKQEDGNSTKK